MKIRFSISPRTPCLIVCLLFVSCAPASYLRDHRPTDLIFQKRIYGGAAALVGTELSAPAFSLYADGAVIYYHYAEGKRKLVSSRFTESEFKAVYARIQKSLSIPLEQIPVQPGAPVTEFIFHSRTITVEGLGFTKDVPLLDTLQEFSASIDRLTFGKNRKHFSNKVIVYVKKLSGGEPHAWPEWKIKEINPDSVYKKDISFYEPNADENSITLEGDLAKKIQKEIDQVSIYQKFSFNGNIYALGYRPIILRE